MPNNITINGRLGRDSETRSLSSGKTVTGMAVASDVGYGDNKTTLWFNCSLWGERGEKLQQYLLKGTQVIVMGEVSTREWETKEGEKRTALEVNVRDVWLVGGKKPEATQAPVARQSPRQAAKPAAKTQEEITFDDDDVPF